MQSPFLSHGLFPSRAASSTQYVGFRNKDLVILEKEFEAVSNKLVMMTDDGSYGKKGLVTNALEELLQAGENNDVVYAIGPVIMMNSFLSLPRNTM